MPKRSRVATFGPMQAAASGNFAGKGGFRKRARRFIQKTRFVKSQAARNDADHKWVNVRDIKQLQVPTGTSYMGKVGLNDLQDAPAFNRYKTLYGKVRVKKIKIEFCDGEFTHQVLTAVSSMDADVPSSQDYLLRQSTLAVHNISQARSTGAPPARTFNLWEANKDFFDWCDTTNTALDDTYGTGASPGTTKAVIKYGFAPQHSGATKRVDLTISYLCEFCNLQDVGSID